jgi:hypothetical protein
VSKVTILPATKAVALEVAQNLRSDDYRELVEGHGLTPVVHVPLFLESGDNIYFTMPNGKTAGLAGVYPDGRIWMICTDVIHDYPVSFSREAKRWLDKRTESLLWNICDKRNTTHLRLLKFLGFKFLREVLHGPNLLPFIEFCKIPCVQDQEECPQGCPAESALD